MSVLEQVAAAEVIDHPTTRNNNNPVHKTRRESMFGPSPCVLEFLRRSGGNLQTQAQQRSTVSGEGSIFLATRLQHCNILQFGHFVLQI
jgi:hypothetical protein